jgi:hypothetical protein
MNRCKTFVSLVALVSVLGLGMAAASPKAANAVPPPAKVAGQAACCDDCPPDCPPDCCPECPSARRQQASRQGYTCPITGEELPCPNCCPLGQK